jgi:hypothetical protein
VIIHARSYPTVEAATAEFETFLAWINRNGIEDVSAWRTKLVVPERDTSFVIVVFDKTGATTSFGWTGEPHQLSDDEVGAFAARHFTRLLDAHAAGDRREVIDLRSTYPDEATAPRVVAGLWLERGKGDG